MTVAAAIPLLVLWLLGACVVFVTCTELERQDPAGSSRSRIAAVAIFWPLALAVCTVAIALVAICAVALDDKPEPEGPPRGPA